MITPEHRLFPLLLLCGLAAVLCPCPSLAWAQYEDPAAPAPLPGYQLDELVAPIALYPDALVAQVLAASTYPTQVTEADNWLSGYPGLTGERLAAAVNSQPWDPSIKALTQFRSVLANMDRNLSWTSALGEAYYYQPQDVLNAVQEMRRRAIAARTLVDTPQQRVIVEGDTVIIEPYNPETVYVPAYNPTSVYGAPVGAYPGYSGTDLLATGVLGFGAGVLVGVLVDRTWGWHGWNTDWHRHQVIYENNVYVSRTNNFYGGASRNRTAGNGRPDIRPVPGPSRQEVGAGQGYRPNPPAPQGYKPNLPAQQGYRPNSPGQGAPFRPAGIPNTGIPDRNPGNGRVLPPAVRNNPRPQAPSANAYRGFGKVPVTGMNKSAFAGFAPGGAARAASIRGRSSFSAAPAAGRARAPSARAPAPAAHNEGRPAEPAQHKH